MNAKKDNSETQAEKDLWPFYIVMSFITLAAYAWLLSVWYPLFWRNAWQVLVSAVTLRQYRIDDAISDESTVGIFFGFIHTLLSLVISVLFYRLIKRITRFDARDKLKWLKGLLITLCVLFILAAPVIVSGRLIASSSSAPIGYLNASLYVMESWIAALLLLMAVVIPAVILGGLIFNSEVHAFLGGVGIILGVILLIFAPPVLCCYLLYTKAFAWPIHFPYWAQALFFAIVFLFVKIGSRISPRVNSAAKSMTGVVVFCALMMAFTVLVFQYTIVLERLPYFGIAWLLPLLRSVQGLTGNVRRTIKTEDIGNYQRKTTYVELDYDECLSISHFWVALFSGLFVLATILGR